MWRLQLTMASFSFLLSNRYQRKSLLMFSDMTGTCRESMVQAKELGFCHMQHCSITAVA